MLAEAVAWQMRIFASEPGVAWAAPAPVAAKARLRAPMATPTPSRRPVVRTFRPERPPGLRISTSTSDVREPLACQRTIGVGRLVVFVARMRRRDPFCGGFRAYVLTANR